MNAEFFEAIEDIEKEKGIPRTYMYSKIEQAMLTAFRRDNPECEDNVQVLLDEDKKQIEMVVNKTVVESVEDPSHEIILEAAKKISRRAKLGDVVAVPVETKKFGRIAAQAAKQVIIQGIREAERGIIYEEFTSKEHEILTGVVSHIEPRNGAVSIRISSNSEFTEAMLSPNERIKTENLVEGDRIKVYVVEVRNSARGPQVLISRTHPGLVKRLFELEVPEIYDGTVEIKSIAREAGRRREDRHCQLQRKPRGVYRRGAVPLRGAERHHAGRRQELPCRGARFSAVPGHRQGGPERPSGCQADRL